jgi:hypothetical protein
MVVLKCMGHLHYVFFTVRVFNPWKTKRTLLYLKTQFVPRSKHFHLGYKSQSVYGVSGTSRCLFSDKYKTHKYSVGRAYNRWMSNLLVHHVTSRLQKVNDKGRLFNYAIPLPKSKSSNYNKLVSLRIRWKMQKGSRHANTFILFYLLLLQIMKSSNT